MILCGAGNDEITDGAGNDTLTGGAGKDIFIYTGGNDVITDYAAGDKISLNAEITDFSIDDANVIFTAENGTITVKDGAGVKITTVTKIGSKTTTATEIYSTVGTYNDKQTAITLGADVKTYEVPTKSAVVSIDGSAVTSGAEITGYTRAEKINGGKGENILTGGDGSDVFINEGGNDTITDYAAGKDKIKFSEEITNTEVSGGDVIFETASGKVTVQDGADVAITYIDYKGKTNKQTYSAENAKTIDLLYDNNFITDDLAIDSICKQKCSVTEIQNTETDELNQPQISYSDEK